MGVEMTKRICFQVTDDDADVEETDATMIIFAATDIAARRCYANHHDYPPDTLAGIHTKRMPEWDQYSPGPVPALDMVDAGWWFECEGCNIKICSDDIGEPVGYDDDNWYMAREYGPDISRGIMRPIEPRRGQVYCCQECHDEDMAEKRRIKRMRAAAMRIAMARLASRHPGVTPLLRPDSNDTYAHIAHDWRTGHLLIHELRISISFPGMRHAGYLRMTDEKWRSGRTPDWAPHTKANALPMSARQRDWHISIANGDQDAWDAWKASLPAADLAEPSREGPQS